MKNCEQGSKIVEALRESQNAQPEAAAKIDNQLFQTAYEQLSRNFDDKEGGFGTAPKFPRPVSLNFLARFYARTVGQAHRLPGQSDTASADHGKHALEMDWSRFVKWRLAECMIISAADSTAIPSIVTGTSALRKNALRSGAARERLPDAFQITKDRQYADVARDILDYVARDMTSKDGGFFSAEDADSVFEHGKPEHGEGEFYVWTEKQIDGALGDDSSVFKFHYGVQPHGNAPEGSDRRTNFAVRIF